MIPKDSVVRVARPTDHLAEIAQMYRLGLGFNVLSEFTGHNGFDGVILGHDLHPWHLEFTHHQGTSCGRAPTKDNLLVFYVPEPAVWEQSCSAMVQAGFKEVMPYNDYWNRSAKTFEDIDGYRVVIESDSWNK